MRKYFIGIPILFAVVFMATALSAADNPSKSELDLRQTLADKGLGNAELDMNLRIHVPENKRLNSLRQEEIMPSVDLWGTLLRPGGDRADVRRPTILISTAYRREFVLMMGAPLIRHGYNVLAIDNRGTGSSESGWVAFDPIEHYDTAHVIDRWIPMQPWSDGKVGMMGASYMAIIQFLAAGLVDCDPDTGEPIHLKALFPMLPMSDPYRIIAAHGGMYEREFMSFWLFVTGLLSVLPPAIYGAEPTPEERQEALSIWMAHVLNIEESISWVMDPDHMTYCDFFKQKSPALYFPKKPEKGWRYDNGTPIEEGKRVIPAKLPVFIVGGWYDIFTLGSTECYQYGLEKHNPADKALVIGPWYHLTGGMGMGLPGFGNCEIAARWFNWKIKGSKDPFMEDFPVLIYVMGADKWRAENDWPLKEWPEPGYRTIPKTLYLSKQRPTKIAGDWFSILNDANNYALVESASMFDYSSPDNPVLRHDPPVLHGKESRSNARWMAGSKDIEYDTSLYVDGIDRDAESPSEDERRDEIGVLTFTTEPLPEGGDIEVVGPLTLTFWARTIFTRPLSQSLIDKTLAVIKEAINMKDGNMLLDQLNKRDVQWIVELNDIFPDGRAKNITSGWLAASHRPYDGPNNPTMTDPGYTPFNPFYYADTFDALTHPDYNLIDEGELYRYVVELWPTCNVFKAGNRIRVSISASDFPHLMPTLIPSVNTIVIDNEHQARLDFKTTTKEGEGKTWKWINSKKGSILKEFAAANEYLLTGSDQEDKPIPPEENPEAKETENPDDSSSSAFCFIGSALL